MHKILPIENFIAKISKLNVVLYRWKESYKPDDREYIGLIAQNVKEVVPEVVFNMGGGKGEMGKYYSVSYEQLVPLLVEGIKEQQAELDTLEAELNALMLEEDAK